MYYTDLCEKSDKLLELAFPQFAEAFQTAFTVPSSETLAQIRTGSIGFGLKFTVIL
jgi:hypothetical protein